MAESNNPFGKSDYLRDSTATSVLQQGLSATATAGRISAQTSASVPSQELRFDDAQRSYGTGKPYRVVMRGKIST
jgi:hypothetical protein